MTATTIGALLGKTFHGAGEWSGASTLFFATVWVKLLRRPHRIGDIPMGWLASVPLAALNAGFSFALATAFHGAGIATEEVSGFLVAIVLGAIGGSVVWVPALLTTMVVFGIPLARAQTLARKGLAGEEGGDRIVGAICAALAVCALVMSTVGAGGAFAPIAAALGGATGISAAVLATLRQRARREFVWRVESGDVEGYRVDESTEGKVLVRISAQDGSAYRVTNFSEEVCRLDAEGNAVEPRVSAKS